MPIRRAIKGVLHNFLGDFTGRGSDYDGYWVFGLVTHVMDHLCIDLLEEEAIGAESDVTLFLEQLARRKFRAQMASAKLPMSFVHKGRMIVTRSADPARGFVAGRLCVGHIYNFSVQIVTDLGKRFRARAQMFVAPHNPAFEHRSTRRR